MKNFKPGKNMWCPTCKAFPDDITETMPMTVQMRTWNGEEYELQDIDFGEQMISRCGDCDTTLEDKFKEDDVPATQDPDLAEEQSLEGTPDA
jgi:hypothetical protein